MGKVFVPPKIEEAEGKIIFLAGPIQGAVNWQEEAIKIIRSLDDNLHVANPRRERLGDDFVYNDQVDWETHFLRTAGKNGVVMFWLTKEHDHKCERAYAQTTRFELAEWKLRHERDGANLVIGIEEGFTNAKYIRKRVSQDCPEVPICTTLEETCRKAVELANS